MAVRTTVFLGGRFRGRTSETVKPPELFAAKAIRTGSSRGLRTSQRNFRRDPATTGPSGRANTRTWGVSYPVMLFERGSIHTVSESFRPRNRYAKTFAFPSVSLSSSYVIF